jgi:hypothetical protein
VQRGHTITVTGRNWARNAIDGRVKAVKSFRVTR